MQQNDQDGPSRDTRSKWAIKMDGLRRLLMWRYLSERLPLYLVTEYPRSGGTWTGQMLSAYLDVPFPRNQTPPLRRAVLHGHHAYDPRFRNVFFVLRDGRDVMTSLYFQALFHNDRIPPFRVEEHRRNLAFKDLNDIRANLPRFLEYIFTEQDQRMFHHTWPELALSWYRREEVPVIRYEGLLADGVGELRPALERVTGEAVNEKRLQSVVEKYSFRSVTSRAPGEENPKGFIRKGVAGDWKEKFNREARQVFDHFAGDALIETGYEADRSWV